VHHESPQVLLIVNGECIFDTSHLDISVSELQEALVVEGKFQ
jgi:bacillithiol system protein YtxJ